MGIDGLGTFLTSKCPKYKTKLPLSRFQGTVWAIDANHFLFTYYAVAQRRYLESATFDDLIHFPTPEGLNTIREMWLESVVAFIHRFVDNQIIPVLVFDGAHPVEKSTAHAKRQAERAEKMSRIDTMREELSGLHPLQRTTTKMGEYRNLLRQVVRLPPDDIQEARNVFTRLGFPCLTSTAEGEKLCVMLCRDGLVDVVYSSDTDVLAYQCPRMTSNFSSGEVEMVSLKPILQQLGLSQEAWMDFCILSGCDYNDRIPGVGNTKAYQFVRNGGRLRDLTPDYIRTEWKKKATDFEVSEFLKHLHRDFCLQEFTPIPAKQMSVEPLPSEFNLQQPEGSLVLKYALTWWSTTPERNPIVEL